MEGKIIKYLQTEDDVYKFYRIDHNHIMTLQKNGYIQIINTIKNEIISEYRIKGNLYDICQGYNPDEYIIVGNEGMCYIKTDNRYQDPQIEINDRYFKGRCITRIAKLS